MQSPMIAANPNLTPAQPDMPNAASNGYTDLQVLRSAAGFYIGTMYVERDASGQIVWQEPGSRDSDYFGTRKAAEKSLSLLTALGDDTAAMVLRDHP